jgi:glucan phosphoethanolaminetransferase (alkaline phosphatase superfamily)
MTLTIINTGSESVSGTITSDKPWAHASPSSFTISGSQTITIKVSVSTYEIEKILLGLLVPFIHKANLLIQFDRDQVYIPVKMRGWFSESYSLSYDLFMLAFFATIFSLGMLPALYFTLLLVDSLTWRLPKVTRWVIGIIAALVVLFGCAILPIVAFFIGSIRGGIIRPAR